MEFVRIPLSEAIKHLSPKTEEEVLSYIPQIIQVFYKKLHAIIPSAMIEPFGKPGVGKINLHLNGVNYKLIYVVTDDWQNLEIYHYNNHYKKWYYEDSISIHFDDFKKYFNINEAIKHLSGKSEEEMLSTISQKVKDFYEQLKKIMPSAKLEFFSNVVAGSQGIKILFEHAGTKYKLIYDKWNGADYSSVLARDARRNWEIWGIYRFNYYFQKWVYDDPYINVNIEEFKKRFNINESIKHLAPRSQEEIEALISKMSPDEKITYGLKMDDIELLLKTIDKHKGAADWFVLRVAIAYNNKILIDRLLKIDNLLKSNQKYLVNPTLQLVKDTNNDELMTKLLRRDEVIRTLTDSEYDNFQNWVHRKHMDILRGDIPGDRQYESLLLEGEINEAINFEKIKTLVSKISDRNSFLQKAISKFNIATNPNIKNYLAVIITILVLSSPFVTKHNTSNIIEKEKVQKIAVELVKKDKISKIDIKHIAAGVTNLASLIPPSILNNAIDVKTSHISPNAKELIKHHEKLKLNAYKIGDGMITIGYGHAEPKKTSSFNVGDRITAEQAEKLFQDDIKETEDGVKRIFKQWNQEGLHIKITQGMFDSMVSMGYNMGIYNLRKTEFIQHLKKAEYNKAAQKIKTTNIAAKIKNKEGDTVFVKMPGLINRRQLEHDLFVKGIYK